MPGLGSSNQNNLGQYIPVATPDTSSYPGYDYYELGAVQYTRQLHSDLGKTTLRGYTQLRAGSTTPTTSPQYLGPMIVATSNRPVCVKFRNLLPTNSAGNLFLPVDTSVMGAGLGPDGVHSYTQNRAVLHLHGGATPWISDGTPHQWITPAGETTPYVQGASVQNVPFMPTPTPGDGTATYYYTNEQSSRLMWYHDHTYGLTRLNVYAGMAAPYLVTDSTEESLIHRKILPNLGGVYRYGIPLIIQDKTFVPSQSTLVQQDPTWNYLTSSGSLWFPHVYMTNQNPNSEDGSNPFGRWDYGPWFWPPVTAAAGLVHGPVTLPDGTIIPGTPNPSIVPEAFMDTPVVNGTAYPYLEVDRKPYRFRILNACNDRYLNLQLYYAEPLTVSVVNGGSGYKHAPKVQFIGGGDTVTRKAKGYATIVDGQVVSVTVTDPGKGYIRAPKVTLSGGDHKKHARAIASINSEVRMVPASPTVNVPPYYPMMDGRAGGVPDPNYAGPSMIQIGTEGGFLPAPVVLPNTPIGYNYNRRDITVLNVQEHTLLLGPAERGDVIIDFSVVPKDVSTVILYNDAPAPLPAFDTRNDYYTNDPNQVSTGGAPTTIAGYGPNTRTIMQFRLTKKRGKAFRLSRLQNALPTAYKASQPAPVVPEVDYPSGYNAQTNTYASIQATSLTFTPIGGSQAIIYPLQSKAIHELFELNYGRMNAVLGVELGLTSFGNQTTIPLGYRDPPTEIISDGDPQLWKITHNGVDTHAIHFHLVNVQLVNRVGWDGMIKPPDANELGWKETIRMNPLEDVIVAMRPKKPSVPFSVPNSTRLLDPTMEEMPNAWSTLNPLTGAGIVINNVPFSNDPAANPPFPINLGWEYVWHCHLLGHEENDMMRPVIFNFGPSFPTNVQATALSGGQATVSFTPPTYVGSQGPITKYTVIEYPDGTMTTGVSSPITVTGLAAGTAYYFTVQAETAGGLGQPSVVSNVVTALP